MAEIVELETERLWLRQWRLADREPFAAMNADPKVMEYFPSLLTSVESDAMADRCQSLIKERGWGFWAAECKDTREFVGYVGLHIPSADLPISPCVEIGWRLAYHHWGKGLASEAGKEALRFGFHRLGLREVVSFAALGNRRSVAVMGRLGMKESGTFVNPHVPEGHYLRQLCLYRLSHEQHAA
jgi:RimJ/RimL family protein N-acetyltransferase